MTNEEIAAKTNETVARIKRAIATTQIEDAVFAAIYDSAAQAYEEAAKAECRYCRLGLPVDAVTGSVIDDLVPLGETYYLHRAAGSGYLHGDMPCESHHIRALKD